MTGLDGDHDSPLDGASPTGSIDEVNIDWAELDQASIDRSDLNRVEPLDQTGLAAGRPADNGLLRLDQPLDPSLEQVPVVDLHPTRLTRATAAEQQELERAYEVDPRPESWIGRINPGFWDDALGGGVGRTENCADCARAFQSTLEGRPIVAGAISDNGLPLTGDPCGGGGEAIDYSEQWAGDRAEDVTYDELARGVAAQRGSAIVLAQGPEGGHAYNVYWDDVHDCIRWADAQQGVVGDWPPLELERRFPPAVGHPVLSERNRLMFDIDEAQALASKTLGSSGETGSIVCRAIPGGWRCWAESQPTPTPHTGSSHVLVRASDGAVARCPSGLLDQMAARLLLEVRAPGQGDLSPGRE